MFALMRILEQIRSAEPVLPAPPEVSKDLRLQCVEATIDGFSMENQ